MITNSQNIPYGYKATALGVIPQEWEIKSLKNACDFLDSQRIPIKDADRAKIPGIYPYYGASGIIDYVNNYIFDDDLILLAEDGANIINRSTPIAFLVNGKIWVNNHAHVLKAKPSFDRYYLCAYLESLKYDNYNTGTAQPKLNRKVCEKIPILVPPLGEQRKIAEVLGVWDLAIAKQVQLVERLTQRKRALMQRLLTAKLRLPGFSAPWKKVHYSDILKEVRRTLTWDEHELYDLISVRRRSGGVFHRESLYGHEIKTKTLRPALEGDFLISKMQIVHGASGVVPKHLSGMKISGSYIALIAKDPKKLNINYFNLWSQMPLFYHQTFVSSYGVHIEKMTFDLDAFMSLSMNLPPIEEQNRIVEVISTATDEIELAQAKLELYRRQKRGLMQQLLTGKKRIKYE